MSELDLDRALLNAMHPGTVPEPEVADAGSFDSGVRTDYMPLSEPPTFREEWREPGGWKTIEIENGAELLFGRIE